MKFTVTAVLCLSFLLVHINLSLAVKKEKGGLLKIFKKPTKSKPDLNPKSKDSVLIKDKQPNQHNQGSYPQVPDRPGGYPNPAGHPGGYPQHPQHPQYPQHPQHPQYPQYPQHPQYPGHPGGYPQYPQYPQYPGRPGGYPNHGGYPQYPVHPAGYPASGYPGHTFGGYGNYPGSYINHNPNNKILSPHYGGSFGFGGYGERGGSPFSHSVQAMGYAPSDKSKGFGRSAVMSAATGAVAGMALGYGLGRFPRPHFHFHNPQEEYVYNHYMYRKYGMKSTDKKDFSRDYKYSQSQEAFDSYMDSCMKRTDLLPEKNRKLDDKQTASAAKTATPASVNATTTGISTNMTHDSKEAGNFSAASISTPQSLNKSKISDTTPTTSQVPKKDDDDDDTVSIVEIGYPALIKQMKVKKCAELFLVYSEKHLKTKTTARSGAQGLETGFQGLVSVFSAATLMLMNSNMLMLQR